MNRGRHRKKKIIQKITVENLINYINSMKNDYTFFNFKSNTPHWFNPYFSTNEQRET
jgi:hypothetical protein